MFLLKPQLRILSVRQCLPVISSISSKANQPGEIPVIRTPKYIENNLGQARYEEHKKSDKILKTRALNKTELDPRHANKLIISSNGDKSMNHYYGFRYNVNKMPSISHAWLRQASIDSQMTFHPFDENPSVLQDKNMNFNELGLNPELVDSITEIVKDKPSLIQVGAIPRILTNRNTILSAETGSGKTIAYLAPVIQMIHQHKLATNQHEKRHRTPYGLVLLPSRELTEQVGKIAKLLGDKLNIGVATIIGGIPKSLEQSGMDLIVTTIGMVQVHIERGVYNLSNLNHLVLDEADTLLDETFSTETMDLINELEFVTDKDSNGTQLICCSATIPTTLRSTIGSKLNLDDDIDQITTKNLHFLHPNVKHIFMRVHKHEREVSLMELLITNRKRPTVIFANRSIAVNWLYNYLNENNFECVRLNSQMNEEERYHAFKLFQEGEVDILVASDLGSRGLDTKRVTHVINFDCPHYVSDYIHRAGRTGRLGEYSQPCKVTTLVSFKPDVYMLIELEKAIRLGVPTFTNPNFARTSDDTFNRSNKLKKA